MFRRKPKEPPSVVGPDGVEYVAMPTSELDRALDELTAWTIDRLDTPAPKTIALALQVVLPNMVRSDATADEARFAGTAAKLGYDARKIEVGYHKLNDRNESLSLFLAHVHDEEADWFQTLCRVAQMLADAASAEAFPTGVTADLLGDTGLGYEGRHRFAMHLLDCLLTHPETGEPRQPPGELTTSELYECWSFGYYLDACEASVPVGVELD